MSHGRAVSIDSLLKQIKKIRQEHYSDRGQREEAELITNIVEFTEILRPFLTDVEKLKKSLSNDFLIKGFDDQVTFIADCYYHLATGIIHEFSRDLRGANYTTLNTALAIAQQKQVEINRYYQQAIEWYTAAGDEDRASAIKNDIASCQNDLQMEILSNLQQKLADQNHDQNPYILSQLVNVLTQTYKPTVAPLANAGRYAHTTWLMLVADSGINVQDTRHFVSTYPQSVLAAISHTDREVDTEYYGFTVSTLGARRNNFSFYNTVISQLKEVKPALVKSFIDHVNVTGDYIGSSALMYFCSNAAMNGVELLLENNADYQLSIPSSRRDFPSYNALSFSLHGALKPADLSSNATSKDYLTITERLLRHVNNKSPEEYQLFIENGINALLADDSKKLADLSALLHTIENNNNYRAVIALLQAWEEQQQRSHATAEKSMKAQSTRRQSLSARVGKTRSTTPPTYQSTSGNSKVVTSNSTSSSSSSSSSRRTSPSNSTSSSSSTLNPVASSTGDASATLHCAAPSRRASTSHSTSSSSTSIGNNTSPSCSSVTTSNTTLSSSNVQNPTASSNGDAPVTLRAATSRRASTSHSVSSSSTSISNNTSPSSSAATLIALAQPQPERPHAKRSASDITSPTAASTNTAIEHEASKRIRPTTIPAIIIPTTPVSTYPTPMTPFTLTQHAAGAPASNRIVGIYLNQIYKEAMKTTGIDQTKLQMNIDRLLQLVASFTPSIKEILDEMKLAITKENYDALSEFVTLACETLQLPPPQIATPSLPASPFGMMMASPFPASMPQRAAQASSMSPFTFYPATNTAMSTALFGGFSSAASHGLGLQRDQMRASSVTLSSTNSAFSAPSSTRR